MKADDKLIDALNECLKYERTLCGCFGGYHAYFARWRFHRLEAWMAWNAAAACKRAEALELHVRWLDATPSTDHYDFELVEVERAGDITGVFDYFRRSLDETAAAYVTASSAAKDDGDATAKHLCGDHQRAVEDVLQRIEAKLNKVELIGPELYLAHHMHAEG